jgi:hypothetical protein
VEEETILTSLELAERRLLIRAEVGGYRFAHDMIAEAIYGDLTLARRRVFHRRALRAIEAAGDMSSTVAELARHALAAEDWEGAARYSQRAAQAAEQIGASRDAVRHYERAVRLLTTSPSREALQPPHFSDGERAALYGALGNLYANLGEKERARLLYEGCSPRRGRVGRACSRDRRFSSWAGTCAPSTVILWPRNACSRRRDRSPRNRETC